MDYEVSQKQITRRLKYLRAKHGLSQPDLAARADVSQSMIAKTECGENIPRLENLIKLARVFGMSLNTFLYGENND